MRAFAGVLLTVLGLILLVCSLGLTVYYERHYPFERYFFKSVQLPTRGLLLQLISTVCGLSGIGLMIFGVQLIIF
jgi:hypothetical protein